MSRMCWLLLLVGCDPAPIVMECPDWYADGDGDGYVDATPIEVNRCDSALAEKGWIPEDQLPEQVDCDDDNKNLHPDATEICDGVDNDCDDAVDLEDAGYAGPSAWWYLDADGDGHGVDTPGEGARVEACGEPDGYVVSNDDCDDGAATIHPGAKEPCAEPEVDHDCDGLLPAEDPDAEDRQLWYLDADGDGEGDAAADVSNPGDPRWGYGCAEGIPGHVAHQTDCDDQDQTVRAQAQETCDGRDEDCDGLTDDADPSLSFVEGSGYVWYRDTDGDGFGLTSEARVTCTADLPAGHAAEPGDCDDQRAHIVPGAEELCDGLDNDCDDAVDLEDAGYAGPSAWWYRDEDGDGHGVDTLVEGARVEACREPAGYVASNDDCDDGDPAVYTGAEESCAVPEVDRDCDGVLAYLDTDVVGGTVWYADQDGDGHGAGERKSFCEDPGARWSRAGDDCDDVDATVYPGAEESCERPEVDHDCDRLPAKLETTIWVDLHPDRDGDGYGEGSAAPVRGCPDPTAAPPLVADDRDCDDADFSAHPGANESCERPLADLNCDDTPGAQQPEFMRGAVLSYRDLDDDGYGAGAEQHLCPADNPTFIPGDCDDHDAEAWPGAAESCEAPDTDRDCDGTLGADQPERMTDADFLYPDADRDSEGDAAAEGAWRCQPQGWVSTQDDCDDRAAAIRPGQPELCNERDDDCDDLIDAADPDYTGPIGTWYADSDRDGFGDPATGVRACAAPAEGVWVTDATDCDDTDATTRPGAPESCVDLDTDRSCDGVPGRDQLTQAFDAALRYADADGDGFGAGPATLACPADGLTEVDGDCDDSAADVHPGATEVCNDRDDDCDALADLADLPTTTWHADADGDGYGDPGITSVVCDSALTPGYVADGTDCDDDANTVNPAAVEQCNGADDDCSGLADDVGTDGPAWYTDLDNDGFGAGPAVHQCTQPAGHVSAAGDCDDRSNLILPGAIERCDDRDNDCDGLTDNDDDDVLTPPTPGGLTRWWPDGDNDGYATGTGVPLLACAGPAAPRGYATPPVIADCDDTNPAVHPDAAELCDDDNVDENCDRLINSQDPLIPLDPFTAGASNLWYPDNDGDGAGDALGALYACADAPTDHVATADDCDDDDAGVRPGAPETCTEPMVDHDCDGRPAFAVPALLVDAVDVYPDRDNDGYGADVATTLGCVMDGWSAEAGDCDDRDAELRPGAPELCNGGDDDCDLLVDDADPGVSGATLTYTDGDQDGFGDAATGARFCGTPADRVTDATDCDDTDALARPGALESCNDLDTDRSCDGVPARDQLDQVPGATLRYVDADSDGFGAGAATFTCSAVGFSEVGGDCDDGVASVRPGATEVCNDLDDNCDALIDEADPSVALTAWYADGDRDGFGGGVPVYNCAQPAGRSTDNTDCDDTRSRVYPDAPERCDGLDNDCDGPVDNADADSPPSGGTKLWNADLDGDGFGDPADGQLLACNEATPLPGYAASEDDCDNGDFHVHPGAQEVCNAGVDDDCDGDPDSADEDVLGDPSATVLWYADADEDGFASSVAGVAACADPPEGYAARPANLVFDCDDGDPSAYPGAPELCDEVDQDCDGGRTWALDTVAFHPISGSPVDLTDCLTGATDVAGLCTAGPESRGPATSASTSPG